MPYSTVVAGTTITASWGNANVRDQVVTPFASRSARNSAIASPVEGMLAPITGDDVISYYNGSAWLSMTPVSAAVATAQSTSSTSYTDLGTVGPTVTIETGAKALVILSVNLASGGSSLSALMSYAVTGASSIAAADPKACSAALVSGVAIQGSYVYLETGLTAGVNTFTAKYRTSTGTATFTNRVLTVIGLAG